MNSMANNDKYLKFRTKIDTYTQKLENTHSKNMACKKGCDMCCLNFDVFPIEFDAIKKQIAINYPEVKKQNLPSKLGENCIFLKDHQCTIYYARPIICRTHGYPLLYMNDTGDQWELSHCGLNFTNVDETYFNKENTYAQDTYNSQLFMLNQEYIKTTHPEKNDFDLIPLSDLLK